MSALAFADLDRLAGVRPVADVPCPLCSSIHNPKRRVLRVWRIAREHVKGFDKPAGVAWRDMTDKLSAEQIAGLSGLLFMYNRFIADITIAIIRLKQAFDGPEDATANKYTN